MEINFEGYKFNDENYIWALKMTQFYIIFLIFTPWCHMLDGNLK